MVSSLMMGQKSLSPTPVFVLAPSIMGRGQKRLNFIDGRGGEQAESGLSFFV